jgi:polar amino acid transport system permease protein
MNPVTSAPAPETVDPPAGELEIRAIPPRHPWRWAAAAVVVLLAAMLVHSMLTNPRYQWDIVFSWLFAKTIIRGLLLTLQLTVISMLVGIALGIVFAVMRGSENKLLSGAAGGYIWFFRGTPLLVQLVFWFNLSALYPRIGIGIPFGGPQLTSLDANALISPMTAAFLGLALNEAAYMAEIVRAGIVSVPHGQVQAATALGLTRMKTMRRIVLPQAMRVIIPPTGNQTISMLKTSSLVSVLAIPELLYSAQIVYSRTFQTIPLLIVVSLWYLLLTSLLTVVQGRIERRFSPDAVPVQRRLPRLRRSDSHG